MTREEFEKWCRENGTGHKVNKSCNGIDWVFVTMKDGWLQYLNTIITLDIIQKYKQKMKLTHSAI